VHLNPPRAKLLRRGQKLSEFRSSSYRSISRPAAPAVLNSQLSPPSAVFGVRLAALKAITEPTKASEVKDRRELSETKVQPLGLAYA
jgi:hypothetical protein